MTSDIRKALRAPTAPTSPLVEPPEPPTTSASQLSDLAEEAGSLRSSARHLAADTSEFHQEALFEAWRRRTSIRGKAAPSALLEEIAEMGFAWRDVARMLGVSVPAIQKWRRSGGVTGENRHKLASLLALCDEITARYHVQAIASWFEMPIISGIPASPIDLYAEGRPELVLEHASGHGDPEQTLTSYDSEWRERFRSSFEVYREADGELSIRAKDA